MRCFVNLLLLLPAASAFLPPRAVLRPVCRSPSRRSTGGMTMEIPAELEGVLDPARVWDVTFELNGVVKTLSVSEETPLLDAAEEAFEDPLLYSCRSGVCNSCAGHCSGEKDSFAIAVESLPDEYLENGYVLTCTTHPTGPGLHVKLNQQEQMLGI